jgi:EmrB/QacA subfamily drug resistance transporter
MRPPADAGAGAEAGEPSLPAGQAPPTTHRALTVVAVMLSMFLAAMEATVVSTAMPTVVGELGGLHLYAWVFAVYMLSLTVTVPIWGKLADLRGRKLVMLWGLGLFLAASVACALAPSMELLIAARALQGLGAGALQPVAMTIVGDLFDVRARGRVQGYIGGVWGLAGLVGPIVGGMLVEHLSWRWVFWINLPFGLGCAAVLWLGYHERPERHAHRLDLWGAATLAGAVVAALAAVRSAGAAAVALPLAVAGLLLFLRAERRAPEPLLPLDLFRERAIAVASACGALMGAAMMAMTTFLPLWAQSVLQTTPEGTGQVFAPMLIGWPLASALSGRLLPRTGYRVPIRLGLLLSAVAAVLAAALLRPGVPLLLPQALTFLYGAGLGLANTPLVIAVQSCVPWNRRGVATASVLFFRTIGGTLSVGLLGGVLAHGLAAGGVAPEVAEQLLGPERHLLEPALLQGLSGALQGAIQTILWAVAAIAVAAGVAALFFPSVGLERAEGAGR